MTLKFHAPDFISNPLTLLDAGLTLRGIPCYSGPEDPIIVAMTTHSMQLQGSSGDVQTTVRLEFAEDQNFPMLQWQVHPPNWLVIQSVSIGQPKANRISQDRVGQPRPSRISQDRVFGVDRAHGHPPSFSALAAARQHAPIPFGGKSE